MFLVFKTDFILKCKQFVKIRFFWLKQKKLNYSNFKQLMFVLLKRMLTIKKINVIKPKLVINNS